ncbi:serine hydrolase domain-containing protein [Nannocystis punicea]|uniref:Beta-lactamase n=1 Tax=Nannocystis punicea TaxID=2995304 RepID=A0ABY7GS36_9BACT|nr:serine hydrolase domain-containing protein [Nannocystis poenicansa]WAS89752.1 serine hydrolase [Nannocystis poenicansa]
MKGFLPAVAALFLLLPLPAGAKPARDIVDRAVEADGFNGVALVGRGRTIDALEARGAADVAHGVPMTRDTRFEVGSISKWIAAIVVLKLVDRGKLDLDAPISRYLPDYRADTGAKLTLRRLMSHSSGLPNQILAARQADPSSRGVELDQMVAVRRYASGDLAFEPGTAWDYSHSNWLVVKAVVERVSGLPYAQLVDRVLVKPLRLRNSGICHGDSAHVPGMAHGYATLVPAPQPKPNPVPDFMAMAGGYYTTAPELMKLMDAVLDGRLLSAAARRTLMTTVMPDQHYALGGRVRIERIAGQDREAAWEDGSNGGFRMIARRVLADGHTVIVMTNASYDHAQLGQLGDALMEASYADAAESAVR